MLENLYFDLRIAPAMCKLWVGKCAPTEMIAWIEKPLIYSYSTRRQRGANAAPTQHQRGANAAPTRRQRGANAAPTQRQDSNKEAMLIRCLISAKSNSRANLVICFNDGKGG